MNNYSTSFLCFLKVSQLWVSQFIQYFEQSINPLRWKYKSIIETNKKILHSHQL